MISDADARHAEAPPGERDAIRMIEQPIVKVRGEFFGGRLRGHGRRLHNLGNFAPNLGGKGVDRDWRVPGNSGDGRCAAASRISEVGAIAELCAGSAAIKPARMPRLPRVAGPKRMRYLFGTGQIRRAHPITSFA